jgi:RNAse (barnase) inhibitor barstar
MAPFTYDESSWSRLDYVLLRDGGVVLYWADAIIEEDLAWLRRERYVVHEFDAGLWSEEANFHSAVAEALEFPEYYGRNLDAFNDCMGDIAVPAAGGMAIVFHNADAVGLREGKFLAVVLDILAGTTRTNLLFGRRLLTLLHSRNPALQFPPVGGMPVIWNPREWLNAKRGL